MLALWASRLDTLTNTLSESIRPQCGADAVLSAPPTNSSGEMTMSCTTCGGAKTFSNGGIQKAAPLSGVTVAPPAPSVARTSSGALKATPLDLSQATVVPW